MFSGLDFFPPCRDPIFLIVYSSKRTIEILDILFLKIWFLTFVFENSSPPSISIRK